MTDIIDLHTREQCKLLTVATNRGGTFHLDNIFVERVWQRIEKMYPYQENGVPDEVMMSATIAEFIAAFSVKNVQ